MCGGDQSAIDAVKGLFECYGTNIQFLGGAGNGQSCKLGNQIAIANNMMGVIESLVFAYKSGLDLNQFINTIKTGAAGSKSLEILGPKMIQGIYIR